VLATSIQTQLIEAGCDEAGRGCYAGPVFAAAVIWPVNYQNKDITDSKKLTEHQRNTLRKVIEHDALAYAVAQVSVREIDQTNILKASIKAMHLALDALTIQPAFIAVDGNRFYNYPFVPHQTVVKGDAKYLNIAAASILAKTYRDEYMQRLHNEFPHYYWHQNKGYGTLAHRQAIEKYGLTHHHRRSFNI
jgi:ribonuclease HII